MSDNNLSVVYGMYDLRPEREEAVSSLNWIFRDMEDIKVRYFKLGFHLDEFKRMKYYEDFGYLTMEEFCLSNLGLDKSAVVIGKASQSTENTNNLCKGGLSHFDNKFFYNHKTILDNLRH